MEPQLDDNGRAKLDGIVQQMISNKESDDNIQAVVNDFKTKYAVAPQPVGQQTPTFGNYAANQAQITQEGNQQFAQLGQDYNAGNIGGGSAILQGAGIAARTAGNQILLGAKTLLPQPVNNVLGGVASGIGKGIGLLQKGVGAELNTPVAQAVLGSTPVNAVSNVLENNPNIGKNLSAVTDVANYALTPSGVESGVAGARNLTTKAVDVATPLVKPLVQDAKAAITNKIAGTEAEQTAKYAQEWKAPADVPSAGFDNARAVLTKAPDTPQFLVEQKFDPQKYVIDGKYSTEEAANALRANAFKLREDTLSPSLKGEDYSIPKTKISDITPEITDDSIMLGKKEDVAKIVKRELRLLQQKYPEGMTLSQMDEEVIRAQRNSNYNPFKTNSAVKTGEEALANRSIAQMLDKQIQAKAPTSLNFKEYKSYLQKYYRAADYLDALNTKKVPQSLTQRVIGKTTRLAGAAVGHSFGGGIVGEFAGYQTGAALEHAFQNIPTPFRNQFFKNLKLANPEAAEKLAKYIQETATKKAETLALPEPSPRIITPNTQGTPNPLGRPYRPGETSNPTVLKPVQRITEEIKPFVPTTPEMKSLQETASKAGVPDLFEPASLSAKDKKALTNFLNTKPSAVKEAYIKELNQKLEAEKSILDHMQMLAEDKVKPLMKYESKSGEYKGQLNFNTGTGKFGKKYDDILPEHFDPAGTGTKYAEDMVEEYHSLRDAWREQKNSVADITKELRQVKKIIESPNSKLLKK